MSSDDIIVRPLGMIALRLHPSLQVSRVITRHAGPHLPPNERKAPYFIAPTERIFLLPLNNEALFKAFSPGLFQLHFIELV